MHGKLIDLSDATCVLCKPKTIGECGHGLAAIDEDWLDEQHRETGKKLKELGRQ